MPKQHRHYKIGTRKSLLALTQSTLIKRELEQVSNAQFELVPIKTQGDQLTDRPLWQLEGKDFFTKELDKALLSREVDLVVHSYKDLGSDRPAGITLAAITKRDFPHDILLIKKQTLKTIMSPKHANSLVVGTSSPRRIYHCENNLASLLPGQVNVQTKVLRGNINTRIEKLNRGEYDAICLALAGLERLACDLDSAKKLQELLQGLTYIVLPRSVFPPSSSQGALAIECLKERSDDELLLSFIKKLNHPKTGIETAKERELFQAYGGGCHLSVGINALTIKGSLLVTQSGRVDGKEVNERVWGFKDRPSLKPRRLFVGMPAAKLKKYPQVMGDALFLKGPLNHPYDLKEANFFITSPYCLNASIDKNTQGHIFVSGASTWKAALEKGYFVNGSADGLGHGEVESFKNSKALQLFAPMNLAWKVLSHDRAESTIGEVYGCYEHSPLAPAPEHTRRFGECDGMYWTSFPQFQYYRKIFPEIVDRGAHFCGLGKTWDQFASHGIPVTPFDGHLSFIQWALA